MFSIISVLTPLRLLKVFCLEVLQPRFIRGTKPLTPALSLGTLTDPDRSKSQLIAENALLRKPLIMLSRQVKQPVCSRADRTLLVLLARLVRTWKQANITRSARHSIALASRALSPGLETEVSDHFSSAEGIGRNHGLDEGKGGEESTVGR